MSTGIVFLKELLLDLPAVTKSKAWLS